VPVRRAPGGRCRARRRGQAGPAAASATTPRGAALRTAVVR
jgi:hypothetical protein